MTLDEPDYTVPIAISAVLIPSVPISGNVSIVGTVNISGTVAISGTVQVSGTVSISGTVTVSGTVAISGTVTVSGSVTVSGTVAISGTVTVSGTVAISGTVTVSGSVTVSGTVAISGTVTISGTVSISGSVTITGNVTITSGAVTISTAAGTNILIDLLAQGAYTERHVTIANDNGVVAPNTPPSNFNNYTLCNKFFPRGCRGAIANVSVYCKRTSTGILVMSISPYPGSGVIITATVTPGANWGWASVNIYRMWNYDSMFIWCTEMDADVSAGYDSTVPNDAYALDANGNVIGQNGIRIYIRAYMIGQTVGDVPVSGTVNNIPIPNTSSQMVQTNSSVPAGASPTVISSVNGSGYCDQIIATVAAAASCSATIIEVVCDGNIVWGFSFAQLNNFGFTGSTPHVTLSLYGAITQCVLLLTKRFEFKQNLTIQAVNSAGAQSVSVYETVCLIS